MGLERPQQISVFNHKRHSADNFCRGSMRTGKWLRNGKKVQKWQLWCPRPLLKAQPPPKVMELPLVLAFTTFRWLLAECHLWVCNAEEN